MSDEHILVKRDGAVVEIRFNRPDKKNAITNAMYGVMADAVAAAQSDDAVRVVLFTSNGDFFSAGNDIKDFAAQATGAFEGPRHVGRFLEEVIKAKKPIVAAVQGHAVGVGATMLFQCDLVYVADDARLTMPFIDLGLVPENASSMTVLARLGYTRAFALFALGEPLMGADAAAWGLANAAVPAAEVEQRARAAAQALAQKPPESLRLTKQLMRDTEALLTRMTEEGEHFAARLQSPEAAAAFAAFLQKR
jgi:enoyl-CoA hydratase/carnithine racemase